MASELQSPRRATLRFFNSLTRAKEPFQPLKPPQAGMYVCGPTVYQYAHIGNLRAYVFADLLRRTLQRWGHDPRHVMNVTDVGHMTSDEDEGEDKILVGARRERKDPWEVARFYEAAFLRDSDRLGILRPHVLCRATEHIPEMIEMIGELERAGYTYEISDGLYYSVERFPRYGQLSRLDLEGQVAGARVDVNPEKRHPADFALWRKATPSHLMQWESPWGPGFPGWHIECSAMSRKYLGLPFDIHTGGVDHLPVHHENEIAQMAGATGLARPVKFWLHCEFLLVDGGKMSKSLGNLHTLEDLAARGFPPLAFRYLCLNTHYRSQLNFTWGALEGAHRAYQRLAERVRAVARAPARPEPAVLAEYARRFDEALADDLNVPAALGVVWQFLRGEQPGGRDAYELLLDWDEVLGLDLAGKAQAAGEPAPALPTEVKELLRRRHELRRARRWAEADRLRDQVIAAGYEVKDVPGGTEVRPAGAPAWQRVPL